MINSNLRPICFNAHKVLPLVFDESLSYYEQLCKLTHTMNEMINVLNGTIDESIMMYIDNRFNDIMLNTMYNADSETLTFFLEDKEV